jgi:hypothetical protein
MGAGDTRQNESIVSREQVFDAVVEEITDYLGHSVFGE